MQEAQRPLVAEDEELHNHEDLLAEDDEVACVVVGAVAYLLVVASVVAFQVVEHDHPHPSECNPEKRGLYKKRTSHWETQTTTGSNGITDRSFYEQNLPDD